MSAGVRPAYFSSAEENTPGYFGESDDFNDDLDRIVAEQIIQGGGEFTDRRAALEAAMLLRNQNVNMGLPQQPNAFNRDQFFNYNLEGEEYERERRRRHEEMYGPSANDQQDEAYYPDPNSLSQMFLGGDYDENANDQQFMNNNNGARTHQQAQNENRNFSRTTNINFSDIPLEDILAFDGANTQETVCTKLEKIMPYYDESLYYACKEYIFQHGLYHKHHLRTIGLSGVPLRYRLLSLWQRPLATNVGKCYFFFETILVGMSLVQVVLETIPAYSTVVNPGWERTWMLTEIPTSICFLLDIIVHLIVLPSFPNDYSVYSRSTFVKSAEFWTDVGSILPTLFMFASYVWPFLAAFDFLKILRVLRFAKVLRQFSSVDQLANTVERSIKPLIAPFVFLFVAVIVNSGLIYYAEHGEYDPEKKMFMQDDCDCESSAPAILNPQYPCPKVPAIILSVPHAMWFSVVTMSSVGYGDYVPRCLLGRIIGTFTILCGSVILAMPIAIVGTYFTDVVGQSNRSGASAGAGSEEIDKTPFHELLSGEQNQPPANNDNNNGDNDISNNNNQQQNENLNNNSNLSFTRQQQNNNQSFTNNESMTRKGSTNTTPQLRGVNSGSGGVGGNFAAGGSQYNNNNPSIAGSWRYADTTNAGPGSNSRNNNNNLLQQQVQKLLGMKAETPGERLMRFLAECNHAAVPLINPSPLIIHQINSFIKKEIEAFLRSLRVRGAYLRLQEAYYNSMTNFTLVAYRDTSSSSSTSKTAALLRQKQQEIKQRLEEKRRRRMQERALARAQAERDGSKMPSFEEQDREDADEEYQLQVQHEELLRKAKLSEKLDEDDFAHDVRVALSQKGEKAPICLRTMPIVLCGPQFSQHMKQTSVHASHSSSSSPSAGFAAAANKGNSANTGGAGASSSSGGDPNSQNNNNNTNIDPNSSSHDIHQTGNNNNNSSMMMGATSPSSPSATGENTNLVPTRITTLISEDGKPLRHFPSGATLLPYCAPGCEVPGVPSPFAILWVCPMTNFVSITAVFPVCVSVNGRQAPFETPQRLLFGDQICVHANGSINSRPLLTYRFTRTEAPVVLNNERAQLYGNKNDKKDKNNKNSSNAEKKKNAAGEVENDNKNNTSTGGRNNTNKNNEKSKNNNNAAKNKQRGRDGRGNANANDDDDDDTTSTIFDQLMDEDRQKTYRVRSLAPDAVREYRAYPLSRYSTTYNGGAGEYTDL